MSGFFMLRRELIDEVVQYRTRGVPIAVITEDHWVSALP